MTFGTAPLNVYLISCSEPPVHALLAIASFLSDPNSSAWDTCDVLVSRAGLVECRNAIAAALPHADAAAPRDDGPRRCNISEDRSRLGVAGWRSQQSRAEVAMFSFLA